MEIDTAVKHEFAEVIRLAYSISADLGKSAEKMLRDGREHPLSNEEARQLLKKVILVMKKRVSKNGSKTARKNLEGNVDDIVERILGASGTGTSAQLSTRPVKGLPLEGRNGIVPGPVRPSPWFLGREVDLNYGFVKTVDIQLWEGNDRLEIHLSQFRQSTGRKPTAEELLAIMLSEMRMPGVTEVDQFEIEDLANSIAVNGVRRPPIIDTDGSLLDGNRRVAACYYILNSDKFTSDQKRRVEYMLVWQLTGHADDDDRNAVVVSLNFEDDCKQPWPEYIRARKVFNEWQAMLVVESRPGPERIRQMKRELSMKFALGTDVSTVTRYLKMVDWANDFEEYHINDKGLNTYEIKHRANECFQYFDELSKGAGAGGVAHTLNQDEGYKHLVFDLLFQDKFKNWTLLRKLKHYDQDVRDSLTRARDISDREEAEDLIDECLTSAANRKREARVTGANQRIEVFVKWLEDLPLNAFKREIRPESLARLLEALKIVEVHAEAIAGSKAAPRK
jgi:hypothetical protein